MFNSCRSCRVNKQSCDAVFSFTRTFKTKWLNSLPTGTGLQSYCSITEWYLIIKYWTCWPDDGAGWRVWGSAEFLQFILRGTWTPHQNHQTAAEIFESGTQRWPDGRCVQSYVSSVDPDEHQAGQLNIKSGHLCLLAGCGCLSSAVQATAPRPDCRLTGRVEGLYFLPSSRVGCIMSAKVLTSIEVETAEWVWDQSWLTSYITPPAGSEPRPHSSWGRQHLHSPAIHLLISLTDNRLSRSKVTCSAQSNNPKHSVYKEINRTSPEIRSHKHRIFDISAPWMTHDKRLTDCERITVN